MFPVQPQPEQTRQPRAPIVPQLDFPRLTRDDVAGRGDTLRAAAIRSAHNRNVLARVRLPPGVPPQLHGLLPPAIRAACVPAVARAVQTGLAPEGANAPETSRAPNRDAIVTPVTGASQSASPPGWAVPGEDGGSRRA